jgi:putative hydrolase of the HAD superfamily
MGMEAVFLDSGGVITRLRVSKSAVLAAACRELGLDVSVEQCEAALRAADSLPKAELDLFLEDFPTFRSKYLEVLRERGGLGDDVERVYALYLDLLQSDRFRDLYPDVLPALKVLRKDGLRLGVVSNASKELIPLLFQLGVASYFDVLIVSQLVGHEKPQKQIFLEALNALEVSAEEAVHVGDSYYHDYLGATRAGLRAILVDRGGSSELKIPMIGGLGNLPGALDRLD